MIQNVSKEVYRKLYIEEKNKTHLELDKVFIVTKCNK